MTCEHWLETTATVKTCDWDRAPSQSPSSLFAGHYTVVFSYAVDSNRYSGKFYSSHEWEKGIEIPVLYNPENPSEIHVCDEEQSGLFLPVLECVLEILALGL